MSRSRDFGAAASSLAAPSSANNGYNHVVDTTQASGWSFSPSGAAYKNYIANGAFDVFQRSIVSGTSVTATSSPGYILDRWTNDTGGGNGSITYSRQSVTPGSIPGIELPYHYRLNQTTAGSGSSYLTALWQRIEDVRTLAGQTVTLSFYAKSDTAGRTIRTECYQVFGTGGSGSVVCDVYEPHTLTTSWQRYTRTFTIPSVSGKTIASDSTLWVVLSDKAINTVHTTDITGVQLEIGSVATPFVRQGGHVMGETQMAQRYYYRDTLEKHMVYARDTNYWFVTKEFPVRMKSNPSFNHNVTTKVGNTGVFPGTAGQMGFYANGWTATNATAVACNSDGITTDHGTFYFSGWNATVGTTGSLQSNALTYFEWSADT